ncbi:MFS transporter [Actinotalea solisilvae]|uniref:MFS transporter n=1 Tax=Actinotalea solisilvae TaxID=2072922 RepID=UPI0027DD9EF7|nr:MFS transporter [Actinotalea solisilvae]
MHDPLATGEDARDRLRAAVQRRTLQVVVATQVLGGAGLAAGVTVGALLAKDMLGGDAYAGLPAAVLTLGSALTALVVGRVSQRHGRRYGLGGGFLVGGAGAVGVVVAARADSALLLFAALLAYGAGTATNLQARYAGTDLAVPSRRGRAASIAMVSTTLGAVVGPNLVDPMSRVATAWGAPALAGPFILAAAAYLAAGTTLSVLLHPDPLLLAERLRLAAPDDSGAPAGTPRRPTARVAGLPRGVLAGGVVMVVAQVVMTAIMTMTPVHMRDHDHSLGAVGMVIGVHIAAMYLPSLVTVRSSTGSDGSRWPWRPASCSWRPGWPARCSARPSPRPS